MTRENKLALIIGFTLILMVGVLVSDHLSRAREAELDAATEPVETAAREQLAFGGSLLADAIDAAQVHARNAEPPVATQVTMGSPAPVTMTSAPTAMAPAVIQQGADTTASTTLTLNSGLEQLNQAADRVLDRLGESAKRPMFESARSTAVIQSPTRTIPAVPRDTGARQATYTVQPGDSLYKIAAKVLGDGNRWREIQQVNADAVGSDGAVKVGQTLRLPGVVVSAPAVREATAAGAPSGGASTYTVRSGDTLGEIASKTLGSSRRMDEIVRANRDQISDADEIRVGMVLKIPAR